VQQTTLVWNVNTNSWDNSYRFLNNYNSNDLPDSVRFQVWSSNAWQDSALTVNSYSADNLTDTNIVETWTGTSWITSRYSIFSYNLDKTIDYIEVFTYWLIYQIEYKYEFTPSRQLFSRDSSIWIYPYFPKPGYWLRRGDETFAYNDLKALETLTTYVPNSSLPLGWGVESQTNYTYNNDGTIAGIITQDSPYGSYLIYNTKTTFHYPATCLLPLTLLSFTAVLNGKAVQLQWTTAAEINAKNFIVQRSIDSMNFQDIGSINAVGDSTQITSYGFTDAGASNAGINKLYYRLQIVDKDGKLTYSNIATVQIENGKLFVIYPNPVRDQLLITSDTSLNNSQIRIFDPDGKVVYQKQVSNTQAATTKINVSGFGNGVYYLQLITGSNTRTTRFLKY
jgi:hypothetical protein